ncbi:hypothetical protein F442_22372 [Phytophthora nicotianae P10297]|uniref:Uncharacterized protein n=1 Tax=Phytophthora nicotianae P10297 TaxID=1317064 RepID=W2XZQ9_PHYNI|nr:hypothetical protein F442_22372 [Phytophthora nicotianae P10297]
MGPEEDERIWFEGAGAGSLQSIDPGTDKRVKRYPSLKATNA